jgi:hypothetical protein
MHQQDAEKIPPAAFSLRSEIQRTEEIVGGRKRWRGFSVRQDPLQGRTAHTKCGMYLLASSLAAALLHGLFEHPARCSSVGLDARVIEFPLCLNNFSAAF